MNFLLSFPVYVLHISDFRGKSALPPSRTKNNTTQANQPKEGPQIRLDSIIQILLFTLWVTLILSITKFEVEGVVKEVRVINMGVFHMSLKSLTKNVIQTTSTKFSTEKQEGNP